MSHQKVTSKFPTNQQAAARHLPCLGQHAMKAGYQLGRNFIGCDIVFDGFHGEAHEQPEAYSERSGKRDLRGAYGVQAREMRAWLMHLQQTRAVSVVFFEILESASDDFGRTEHRLQIEGSRTSRELSASNGSWPEGRSSNGATVSAYGLKADHLGRWQNMSVFEQEDPSEWDGSSALEPSAFIQRERRVPCVKTCAAS